jgi:hypothetical protein
MWAIFRINKTTNVIDIGGSLFNWELARSLGLPIPRLTIVNIDGPPQNLPDGITWSVASACDLKRFADREFDVAVSNSVIEHLYNFEAQREMANEARRVASAYWIQTPDPRFPVEPHYLTPFIHWFPPPARKRMARFTVWGLLTNPGPEEIATRIKEIRLVSETEMRTLFPDSRLIVEKFVGWPKSLIAYKH